MTLGFAQSSSPLLMVTNNSDTTQALEIGTLRLITTINKKTSEAKTTPVEAS